VISNLREAGYIMRVGVVVFVLPIWVLAIGFFALEEMYLYAGLMTVFGALMLYGAYMNWKRISSDEKNRRRTYENYKPELGC